MRFPLHLRPALYALLLFPVFLNAQWTKTNGLAGGSVNQYLHYGDTIIAHLGRTYFSSDQGQSWTAFSGTAKANYLNFATDGHTLYEFGYSEQSNKQLWWSDDFGQSWDSHPLPDTLYFYDFFATADYVYGSDYQGIYRSADHGASWEFVTTSPVSNLQFDGVRMVGNRLGRIVESLDGGISWDTLLQFSGNVIDMLQHDNYLFAFMQNATNGCWASSDYGQTWQHYTGTAFDQYYDLFWHNGAIYGLKGSQMFKSTDLGQSWTTLDLPDAGYPAYTGISAGDAVLIGGVSSGVLRSTDGGASWFSANLGILSATPSELSVTDEGLFAPAVGGVFHLQPDGLNWQNMNYPITLPWYSDSYASFMQAGNQLIAGTGEDNPWVSLDGGLSWVQSFVAGSSSGGGYFRTLGQSDGKVIGLSDNGDWANYFVSDNDGLTFQPLNTLDEQFGASILLLDVSEGQVVALGYDKKLYRSSDGGTHWAVLSDNVPIDSLLSGVGGYGSKLFRRGNSIFIFGSDYPPNYLLFSHDLGVTWTVSNLGTANFIWGISNFSDLIAAGNYLVAATDRGAFRSSDGGQTWEDWNDGLVIKNVSALQVHDGYLWAAASGDGIWKRPLSDLDLQLVSGRVFWDQNNNAQADPGEPGLSNFIVKSTGSNAFANTHADGTYTLYSGLAEEVLKVYAPAPYWTSTPPEQTAVLPSSSADFALSLDPSARDLSVALTNVSALQPGFEFNYVITWHNRTPLPASDVSLTLTYPPDLLEFVQATPAPATQSSGTMSWQPGNIAPDASGNIIIRFLVPATVPLGAEICSKAEAGPLAGDLWPGDNTRERCVEVVGSFDPNEKQSEPAHRLTPTEIAAGQPVVYTVRFQNTGNFPASFVRITDTLDGGYNAGTFQFLGASHPCSWTLLNEGALEFMMTNINLPPALLDEPGSHGFIQYSVQAKPDLPLGTPLRNTAHIYFDYNAPVITNTTVLEVSLVNRVEAPGTEPNIMVSPNPAVEFARIAAPEPGLLTVRDASGRLIWQNRISAGQTTLDVRGWAKGVYMLRLENEGRIGEATLVIP